MAEARKQKRYWCFTSYLDKLPFVFDKNIVRYYCCQRETCPKTGRLHWQGYCEFLNGMRMGQVKTILGDPGCHLEYLKTSRHAAREYCRKIETAVPHTFVEFGHWRQDIARKRKLCEMLTSDMTLDDIIDAAPVHFIRYHRGFQALRLRRQKKKARTFRHVKVICFIGDTGCGKTRRAAKMPGVFFPPSGGKWYDGYEGEPILCLDDFYGGIKYATLLRLLDGHPLLLPTKGSHCWALYHTVIITSNKYPDQWYKFGMTPALRRRITEIIPMSALSPIGVQAPLVRYDFVTEERKMYAPEVITHPSKSTEPCNHTCLNPDLECTYCQDMLCSETLTPPASPRVLLIDHNPVPFEPPSADQMYLNQLHDSLKQL